LREKPNQSKSSFAEQQAQIHTVFDEWVVRMNGE
jgi:hypothetical protein